MPCELWNQSSCSNNDLLYVLSYKVTPKGSKISNASTDIKQNLISIWPTTCTIRKTKSMNYFKESTNLAAD